MKDTWIASILIWTPSFTPMGFYSREGWAISHRWKILLRAGILGCTLFLFETSLLADGSYTQPKLVQDLEKRGTYPLQITIAGERIFYVSRDPDHGEELWVYEKGQERLVTDLVPGSASFAPDKLIALGDRLIFSSLAPSREGEIWVSDGTAQGTRQLQYPQLGDTAFVSKFHLDGPRIIAKLYYHNGFQLVSRLLSTDGTPENTFFTEGIHLNALGSTVRMGEWSYFIHEGRSLRRTDGTAVGTTLVYQPTDDTTAFSLTNLAVAGNHIYFSGTTQKEGHEIWCSDGTQAGTGLLKDIYPGELGSVPIDFQVLGNRIVFTAYHPAYGTELWVSDGTPSGTQVLDLLPGPASTLPANTVLGDYETPWGESRNSQPSQFCVVGNRLYFAGYTPKLGVELWVTDGTLAGSRPVVDALPGPDSVYPDKLIRLGDRVIFEGFTPRGDRELWISDGTASGSFFLKDLAEGHLNGDPEEFNAFQNGFVFRANDGEGMKLWMTDGTANGTRPLSRRFSASFDSQTFSFQGSGDLLYFHRQVPSRQTIELWRSDGTATGTFPVIEIPGAYDWGVTMPTSYQLFPVGEQSVLWTPWYPEIQTELWASDGTPAGTGLVQDISANSTIIESVPQGFVTWGGSTYFVATRWSIPGLWRLTPDGTVTLLKEYVTPSGLHVFNDRLYFLCREGHGQPVTSLYSYDGNTFTRVKTLESDHYWVLSSAANFGGFAYLELRHDIKRYLWRTDGTEANTQPFTLVPEGKLAGVFGHKLLIIDSGIWTTDGTEAGTTQLSDSGGSDICIVAQDKLFFTTFELTSRSNTLWVSDGRAVGTRPLKRFPLPNDGTPAALLEVAAAANQVFFAGTSAKEGRELWVSDGTPEGTRLAADLVPGPESSSPSNLTVAGNRLYFTARDSRYGRELFSLEFSQATPSPIAERPLINLSARARLEVGEPPIIAGFGMSAGEPARFLMRGIGPGLQPFDVTDFADDPTLSLYDGDKLLASNDDWRDEAFPHASAAMQAKAGAFGLAAGSRDAALVASALGGAGYTLHLSTKTTAGIGLIELYDVVDDPKAAQARNLSCRSFVGASGDLILGFVIGGTAPRRLLIRAAGPALAPFGVPDILEDPALSLYQGSTLLETNDNWSQPASRSMVTALCRESGAFPFSDPSPDSILVTHLEPGAYTAVVSGKDGKQGNALVEIYLIE